MQVLNPVIDFSRVAVKETYKESKKAAKQVGIALSHPDTIGRVVRCTANVIEGVGLKAAGFAKLVVYSRLTDDWISIFDVTAPISFFATKKLRDENPANIIFNLSALTASLGGFALLLKSVNDKVNLFNFGKIGAMYGKVPVLGGLTFETFTTGSATVVFACVSIDAVKKIINGDNPEKRIHALLQLAWGVTTVAMLVFAITGALSVPGLVILATLAAGLGIVAYLYNANHKDRIETDEDKQKKVDLKNAFRNGSIAKRFAIMTDTASSDGDCMYKSNKVSLFLSELTINVLKCFENTDKVREFLKVLNSTSMKALDEVFKAKSFLTLLPQWLDPMERQKLLSTWQKGTSKAFLTLAAFMDTVSFVDNCISMDKLGCRYFAQSALSIGDKLPVFDAVKNGFVLASATFSILEAGRHMKADVYNGKVGIFKARRKYKMWNNSKAKILKRHYQNKKDRVKDEAKIARYDEYLKIIDDTADKKMDFDALKTKKIARYSDRLTNQNIEKRISWVSIAADVGKIACVAILGIAGLYLGWAALSYIIFGSVLGLVSSGFGLTKSLYKTHNCKVDVEPHFLFV